MIEGAQMGSCFWVLAGFMDRARRGARAENVAAGVTTRTAAIALWSSPGHAANMQLPGCKAVAHAVGGGVYYWTMVIGQRTSPAPGPVGEKVAATPAKPPVFARTKERPALQVSLRLLERNLLKFVRKLWHLRLTPAFSFVGRTVSNCFLQCGFVHRHSEPVRNALDDIAWILK